MDHLLTRILVVISFLSLLVTNACGADAHENILFTHRGLSGPAILQISNYWDSATEIGIDLLPDVNATASLERSPG